MKILFTARATAVGGRAGHAKLDDGSLELDIAMPGSGRKGLSPEQLFAMGYSACFDGAVGLVARNKKLPLASSKTSAEVGLGQLESGGYKLDVDLYLETSGLTQAQADELIAAAHEVCPYSKATHNNIEVRLHAKAL